MNHNDIDHLIISVREEMLPSRWCIILFLNRLYPFIYKS
uniref:Uncharacterized protein n=1 Tax=Anguilla anguilla TaxID=7936 RepID=A0A0E9S659_ANGAN